MTGAGHSLLEMPILRAPDRTKAAMPGPRTTQARNNTRRPPRCR